MCYIFKIPVYFYREFRKKSWMFYLSDDFIIIIVSLLLLLSLWYWYYYYYYAIAIVIIIVIVIIILLFWLLFNWFFCSLTHLQFEVAHDEFFVDLYVYFQKYIYIVFACFTVFVRESASFPVSLRRAGEEVSLGIVTWGKRSLTRTGLFWVFFMESRSGGEGRLKESEARTFSAEPRRHLGDGTRRHWRVLARKTSPASSFFHFLPFLLFFFSFYLNLSFRFSFPLFIAFPSLFLVSFPTSFSIAFPLLLFRLSYFRHIHLRWWNKPTLNPSFVVQQVPFLLASCKGVRLPLQEIKEASEPRREVKTGWPERALVDRTNVAREIPPPTPKSPVVAACSLHFPSVRSTPLPCRYSLYTSTHRPYLPSLSPSSASLPHVLSTPLTPSAVPLFSCTSLLPPFLVKVKFSHREN